jgi:hypothetical protein
MNAEPPQSTTGWSARHTAVFISAGLMLAALPWLVSNYPTQDGPNHLAVAHVVATYDAPGSPFPAYWTLDGGPLRPSTGQYWLLCGLARLCSLAAAEKVLVSLATLLLPLAAWLFARRTVPRRSGNVLLLFPLVTGWALAMGFVAFVLALGFGILVLALGWQPEPGAAPVRWRLILAAVLHVLCAWLHPAMAVFAGVALLTLLGPRLRHKAGWRNLLIVTGPAAAYVVIAYVTAHNPGLPPQPHTTGWYSTLAILKGLLKYQVAYSGWELIPRGLAVMLLLGGWAAQFRRTPLWGGGPECATFRLVAVFLGLYAIAPGEISDWYYFSVRFLLIAIVVLPAAVDLPKRITRFVPIIATTLTAAVIAIAVVSLVRLDAKVQEVRDAGADLPRGSRLISINFGERGPGLVEAPQPLAHAWAHLVVDRDIVSGQLFAAGKPQMGGERFRMLSMRPEVLQQDTGALPWPGFENAYALGRSCDPPATSDCRSRLLAMRDSLNAVVGRYDFILMIAPPEIARTILTEGLSLRRRVGDAWIFPTRQDRGR